jgi:hypothetical protein
MTWSYNATGEEINKEEPELPAEETILIDPFIVAGFLRELYELSRRFIWHHFGQIEENLGHTKPYAVIRQ